MPNRNMPGERKDQDNEQQKNRDDRDTRSSPSERRKSRDNPGNFANDPKRASDAGRKGGRS